MRFTRITFWGSVANLLYFSTVTIPVFNLLSQNEDLKSEIKSLLTIATQNYIVADSDYNAALSNLTDAQVQIKDANCYLNNYDKFTDDLISFCSPRMSNNSLYDLTANYGLDIVVKPSVLKVFKNYRKNRSNQDCNSWALFGCHTATSVVTENYGISLVGVGENELSNCGQFSNGIVVSSKLYLKDSATKKIDPYSEAINDTYVSIANVGLYIDSVINKSVKYEVEPVTSNIQDLAKFILSQVTKQCKVLNDAIKSPLHYSNIIFTNSAIIPTLNATFEHASKLYKEVISNKAEQQAKYDSAIAKSNLLSIIALASIIIQSLLVAKIIHNENQARAENHNGYATCGSDLNWAYSLFRVRTGRQQAPQVTRVEAFASRENAIDDAIEDLNESIDVDETTWLQPAARDNSATVAPISTTSTLRHDMA